MKPFIHTFEIKKRITYEQYDFLRKHLKPIVAVDPACYKYQVNAYKDDGITISLEPCTKNEIKQGDYTENHLLILKINPSRLLQQKTYLSVTTEEQMEVALSLLEQRLTTIFNAIGFYPYAIDDFLLSRIDLTYDVKNIPEEIRLTMFSLLWRLPLMQGYSYNESLLNLDTYDRTRSFDLHNTSKGIDFCIYDKQKACIDQNFSKDVIDSFSGTVRVELRCYRKYIRTNLNPDETLINTILSFYKSAEQHIKNIYRSAFKYDTSLCYLSKKLLSQYLTILQLSDKKAGKMDYLIYICRQNKDKNFSYCLSQTFDSDKVRKKVLSYFSAYSISPLTIQSKHIPFLQSLDSLLEIHDAPSKSEKRIYHFAEQHTRKKEVFYHV